MFIKKKNIPIKSTTLPLFDISGDKVRATMQGLEEIKRLSLEDMQRLDEQLESLFFFFLKYVSII